MPLAKRIIPCLDVTAGRVVKGVNFVGLRDAGDPVELAERYDAEGADELVFLDITATVEGRAATLDVEGIRQAAPVPRFSATPGRVRGGPPVPGAHTAEVLRAWGVSDD